MTTTISPEPTPAPTPMGCAARGAHHPHANPCATPISAPRAGAQTTDSQLSDDAQKALAVGASSPTSHPPVGSQTMSAGGGSTSRRQVWCAATAANSEPRREAHDNPEPILRSRPTALTARGADRLTDHADRSAHGRPVGEAHTPPATIIRTIPKAVPSLADPFSPDAIELATPTVDPRPGLVHPADHVMRGAQAHSVCGVSS